MIHRGDQVFEDDHRIPVKLNGLYVQNCAQTAVIANEIYAFAGDLRERVHYRWQSSTYFIAKSYLNESVTSKIK